jgi:hypothetical protein
MPEMTKYEAEQVGEIALWKSERPSLLLASYRRLVSPFSRLVAHLVPDGVVERALDKVEAMSEVHDFAADIREAGGISAIPDLLNRGLDECDRLCRMVSVKAEHRALLEGAVPAAIGVVIPEGGGAAAAVADVPFLLEASLRAIRRIGHCYGFALDSGADRRFVLAILNLANSDERAGVEELRCGLWAPDGPPDRKADGSDTADSIKESLADDLPIEAMPLAGDVANLVLDHAFVRRVDATARRVFQERWLRANGKVESIEPAPGFRRRSSVEGIAHVASEVAYAGAYGVSFGVTFPATLAGLAVESVAPPSVLRGFRDGASAAARDSTAFLEKLGRAAEAEANGSLVPALPG